MMRTTIEIEPELLRDVTKLSGEKSVTRAVNKVLGDYVRRTRAQMLLASFGTRDLDLDDWYEFRHRERD